MLSIDVVLGVVISSITFWRLPDGSGVVNMPVVLALATATWMVYILDRILDLKMYPPDHSARHRFHYENQYILSVLCLVLGVIGLVLCFFMPLNILKAGVILLLFLGGYFVVLNKVLGHTRRQWIKEPVTALFYVLAVIGMVFIELPSIWLSSWILAAMFFFMVSQNLLLFSWFESRQTSSVNTVSYLGSKRSVKVIRVLGILNILLAIFFFGGGSEYVNKVAITFMSGSVFLSFMTAKPHFFEENERYRWLGDAVFLFPAWLLFF